MPQTIQASSLNTVTLPANDLATVNFSRRGTLSVMNYGPGKVMVSSNPAIIPTMTSTNCLLLGSGVGYNAGDFAGNTTLLMIADTVSTVVSISYV